MQQNTTGCRAIKSCKQYVYRLKGKKFTAGYRLQGKRVYSSIQVARKKSLLQDTGYKGRVRYAAARTCTGFMVS
jgi:hypothetical protein